MSYLSGWGSLQHIDSASLLLVIVALPVAGHQPSMKPVASAGQDVRSFQTLQLTDLKAGLTKAFEGLECCSGRSFPSCRSCGRPAASSTNNLLA